MFPSFFDAWALVLTLIPSLPPSRLLPLSLHCSLQLFTSVVHFSYSRQFHLTLVSSHVSFTSVHFSDIHALYPDGVTKRVVVTRPDAAWARGRQEPPPPRAPHG